MNATRGAAKLKNQISLKRSYVYVGENKMIQIHRIIETESHQIIQRGGTDKNFVVVGNLKAGDTGKKKLGRSFIIQSRVIVRC